MLSYLETTSRNYAHLMEYKRKQEKEQQHWKTSAEEMEEEIFTNQRKTYYEHTGIEVLNWWYKAIWFIYFILVLVYIVNGVANARRGEGTVWGTAGGGLMLVSLPYWLSPLVRSLYGIWMYVYGQLPQNAYRKLGEI